MVSTWSVSDEARSAAVPTGLPDDGTVNMRVAAPVFARDMPGPESVMMILPFEGTVDAGVRVTYIVTDDTPLEELLSVMMGAPLPKEVPTRIAGYLPMKLEPTMVVPSLRVTAAATLVISF